MKNLKKLSRNELNKVKGAADLNCHCAPMGSGKPAIDTIAASAEACFAACDNYRNS